MKHLIIIGVGGFAREVYWHAQDSLGYGTEWDIKGFLDGDVTLPTKEYEKLKLPVLGDVNSYEIEKEDIFFCAVGNGEARKRIVNEMLTKKAEFLTLIHNTALIHGNVMHGMGCLIGPRVGIGDHAKLGNFVILNTASGVGHDARLDDYVSIMSYVDITGYCHLEEGVMFGSGARILPHGRVGEYATVGAGSVVLRKVKPRTTVFGNPAVLIPV